MRVVLAGILFALLSLMFAKADERILRFQSDVVVNVDGRIEVTETIEVNAEGNQIKRGIYRDFPTVYRGRFDERIKVDFDILDVTKDGGAEPYFLERQARSARLYIGHKDAFVRKGRIVYRITYATNRQIGHFDDHDELYWNVTGNRWAFPIDKVEARVHLPKAVQIKDSIFYTGKAGAKGKDAVTEFAADGSVVFQTVRTLSRGEGLTIAVAFNKGVVIEPGISETTFDILKDNLHLFIGFCGLIAIGLYYAYVWNKVGRDPPAGPEVPRYEPPEGMSPAAMAYVRAMCLNQRAFSAAIISLAVKGALTIEDEDGDYCLTLVQVAPHGLSKGERALHAALFREDNRLELKQKNYKRIQKAKSALNSALSMEYETHYFHSNISYWSIGFAIALFTVIAMFFASVVLHLPFTLFGVVLIGAMLILLGLFYYLLAAPTLLGRRALDHMEGFRLFLSLTEKDRLNFLNPPECTPQLFEQFLPHAIALGVEHQWGEIFERALLHAGMTDASNNYHPYWYHGRGSFSPTGFATGLGSGFNSALASAAAPPSSSSTSGFSGGSSGGGGGGGGGGGW